MKVRFVDLNPSEIAPALDAICAELGIELHSNDDVFGNTKYSAEFTDESILTSPQE